MCRSKSRWGEGQSGFWRGQKTSLSKRSWKSSPRALHVAVVGEQSKWQKQSLTGKAATLVAGDGGATTSTRPHLFYQLWHSSNNFPCVSLYWQAQYPQPFEAKAASNSSTNAYVVRLPTTEVSQQESKYITQMQIFKLLLRHLPSLNFIICISLGEMADFTQREFMITFMGFSFSHILASPLFNYIRVTYFTTFCFQHLSLTPGCQ